MEVSLKSDVESGTPFFCCLKCIETNGTDKGKKEN